MFRAAKRKAPEPQVGSRTRHVLDGIHRRREEDRCLRSTDHVLGELADIQVLGDEVVDRVYLACRQFARISWHSACGALRARARFPWAGQNRGGGRFQPLAPGYVDAADGDAAGNGRSTPLPDRIVDIAVGVVAQQRQTAPSGSKATCISLGGIEQEGDDRVLADVVGDVLLGVVGPHLLLVDVFLEDVAEHVRVDLVVVAAAGGRRGATGTASKKAKICSKASSGISMSRLSRFELMHVEEAAVEVGHVAEQPVQVGGSARCLLAEALVEQAQQEITVEGVELVLPPALCIGCRRFRR